MPFSESWLDILLLPITILGFWIAFRQNEEDKIRKSRKPDLMNLMNFIYENYMKFSYLFDLREHDLIYQKARSSENNNNLHNELYVSFVDFNLSYIVASSKVPDYTIDPDKFAIESKEIYEMALNIKQDLNQYNETLNLFCENDGKWERDSIDDYRNILERISKETFINTFELYNSLKEDKTGFKKLFEKLRGFFCSGEDTNKCNCENDYSLFKKNREKQILDRLVYKKKSANSVWAEPLSLSLLRSFLCIPYTLLVNGTTGITPRKQYQLLYNTFLYNELSIDCSEVVYNELIQHVTKYWIKDPKPQTHFFICDYITTIEEFLTYSSLKSKFTGCKLGNVAQYSKANIFVGTRDLKNFLDDVRRLDIESVIIDISNSSQGVNFDPEKFYYIKAKKIDDAINYVNCQLDDNIC